MRYSCYSQGELLVWQEVTGEGGETETRLQHSVPDDVRKVHTVEWGYSGRKSLVSGTLKGFIAKEPLEQSL